MSVLQPLTLIVAEPRDERVWTALSLAATAAAQGRKVTVFLSGHAAAIGLDDYHAPGDSKRSVYCVATVAELLESSIALGVRFIACQTGLHLIEHTADELHIAVETGGMMSALAAQVDAQIILI
jgi:peroxiredoxin family protein